MPTRRVLLIFSPAIALVFIFAAVVILMKLLPSEGPPLW